MARLNAITREQLLATVELLDKVQAMGDAVTRLEVNFGAEAAGAIVRDGAELVFIPSHKEPQGYGYSR